MNTLARLFAKSASYLRGLFGRSDDGFASSMVKRQHGDHYLRERYGMDEKPAGWNRAVLGWFFRGPDRRAPLPPVVDTDREGRQRAYDQRARLLSRERAGLDDDERAALVRGSIRRSYLDQPLVVGKGGKIIREFSDAFAERAARTPEQRAIERNANLGHLPDCKLYRLVPGTYGCKCPPNSKFEAKHHYFNAHTEDRAALAYPSDEA